MPRLRRAILAFTLLSMACGPGGDGPPGESAQSAQPDEEPGEEWVALFNGADLTGWTPKITGYALGDDPMRTFRVEDGLLTVDYENYRAFDGHFGHLFYEAPFSHYELRIEYRFVGEQITGGPGWALRNSGVMFHAQSPESMGLHQDFPISLEAQFLGGDGENERATMNLCTPGTHVYMEGELVERHCIGADAPTFHGEAWVTVDLVVHGDSLVTHVIDGTTVLSYERPVMGLGNVNNHDERLLVDGQALSSGYIALQSESHPIQFRQVLIRELGAP